MLLVCHGSMGKALAHVLTNDIQVCRLQKLQKEEFYAIYFVIASGIFCVATVLIPEEAILETLVVFLISKTMISASFLIIYPFAGELYPTQVRGVGIGTSSYIGGMGLIVIPFITYLVC